MKVEFDLTQVMNLGPKSASWLTEAGITCRAELEAAGPVQAILRVEEHGHTPSLNLLYAIAAGRDNVHIDELTPGECAELRAQLEKARS